MHIFKRKKFFLLIFILFIAGIALGGGGYYYTTNKAYHTFLKNANIKMEQGEYDQAITLFEQALQYKQEATIAHNITLAKNLKEVKKLYEKAVQLQKEQNYLDAIEIFEKIRKEDGSLYMDAQGQIQACRQQYVEQTLKSAESLASMEDYESALQKVNAVLQIESDQGKAQELKAIYTQKEKEKREQEALAKAQVEEKARKEAEEKNRQNNTGSLTQDQALQLIARLIGKENGGYQCTEEQRNGVSYYIIQAFDNMGDHIATTGWYYVEKNTGKAFEWDLVEDKLIPLT